MAVKRFEYIDGLRGLAILGVIITHAASLIQLTGLARQFTNILGMGVQLFFVISAFTIFFSLSRADGTSQIIFRDFFIKRLFRIVPVYWFGIIFYTLVYGLESRGWREGPEFWHYPYHVFLINVLHPLTSSSVVPGGWSISVEVLFYILAPFIFLYVNTKNRVIVFMVVVLVALPIGNILLKKVAVQTLMSGYEQRIVNNFFFRWPISQLACFGFGLVMFRIINDGLLPKWMLVKSLNKIVIICCLAIVFSSFLFPKVVQQHHLVSFLFMCIGILLSVNPWSLLVNRFTVYMGKISYSSYLIHFFVVNQLFLGFQKYFPSMMEYRYSFFILLSFLSIAFTIPLARIGYRFIEQPSIAFGKYCIERLSSRKVDMNIDQR